MKWTRGAVGGTHRRGAEGTDRAQRARDLMAKWYETLMISQRGTQHQAKKHGAPKNKQAQKHGAPKTYTQTNKQTLKKQPT